MSSRSWKQSRKSDTNNDKRWFHVKVNMDMKLTPWLAILILLASTAITFSKEVVHGFVGSNGIEPYSIVILIFALAYICISLDESGLLSYVAVHVTSRWGRNGRVLLLCFYALSTIMAVITNNDVVVLCLTPIICIFSDTTGADAEPFLIAMFIAANTASMALFIGNPTNIIVAEANDISFLSYSAWMGLPFLGAAVAGIAVLYLTSLRKIPQTIAIDMTIRPRDMLRKIRQAAIVESLSQQGWTPRLAWVLKRMCSSPAAAVFIVGAITTLACNVLNNLPMSILFSRALQHPIFAQVDSSSRKGAMFALIIGSNVGANFTLVGSLAGLMFQGIASQKKREIGYFTFMRWCAPVMVAQLATACAILVAELAIVQQ
ncbi:hypothetical protein EV181_003706 [Coemansia sp. RSA 532]|nr:hypothetical protein EV181_003706 [Coemansia sp. RSA 532]